MRYRILLLVSLVISVGFSCRKQVLKTHIILHIVDEETNLPLPGAKVAFYAFASGMYHYRDKVVVFSDYAGNVNVTIPGYIENKPIESDVSIYAYSDTPYFYCLVNRRAPLEKTSELTIKLSRAAAIYLNYHPLSTASVLDSLQWGIDRQKDYSFFFSGDIDHLYEYTMNRNLHTLPGGTLMNSDTTIRIYCDPTITTDYYYRVHGNIKVEKCSLKRNDVMVTDIYY